jgi:hypothetical protein
MNTQKTMEDAERHGRGSPGGIGAGALGGGGQSRGIDASNTVHPEVAQMLVRGSFQLGFGVQELEAAMGSLVRVLEDASGAMTRRHYTPMPWYGLMVGTFCLGILTQILILILILILIPILDSV